MMTTYELAAKQASARTASMTNALVEQKDTLLNKIKSATDSVELQAALDLLHLFGNVWRAADYGYKIGEVQSAIDDRAWCLVKDNEEFLEGERKNSRHRNTTEAEIRKLHQIRNNMNWTCLNQS